LTKYEGTYIIKENDCIKFYIGDDFLFKERRLNEILQYITNNNEASVEELAKYFSVSLMTIRRDLKVLEQAELISRTHGGAISLGFLKSEELYESKQTKNYDEKVKISNAAIKLISELTDSSGKVSIFLDAGTTTYQIALQIKQHFNGLVIFTNDLKIASELYNSQFEVFVIGGKVQPETGSIFGHQSSSFINRLNIDICFVGVQAINSDLLLLTPSEEKSLNKQNIMRHSCKKILVCDSSKFNRNGLFYIAPISDFDYVVTNYAFNDDQLQKLSENDTNVINV
jgi:DeoR/GlpR family transcriptional regulator of sugar metabolism